MTEFVSAGMSNPDEELDLTPILNRLNAATPGQWEWPAEHADIFTVVAWTAGEPYADKGYGTPRDIHCSTEEDAEFIGYAKRDIAALLQEVYRLRVLVRKQHDRSRR